MWSADDRRWTRLTWLLLATLGLLRTVYLWRLPLELSADEAYYWDWSRQLAWGYYSKPPLIAWIIAAATAIGGDNEFAIRFPAVLLTTIGLIPVSALGTQLFDRRVGFFSVVVVAATPGMTAASILMTIDAPFLCAWAFSLWCVWNLLSSTRPDLRWVLPCIVATGCGLLAKQTMFALFPLTALWLLMSRHERWKLGQPAVWLWWGGSLACLTPVVWWNAEHGWITLQHTSEHFQQHEVRWSQHLRWFIEFWASQFGILSPLSCGVMIVLTVTYLPRMLRFDRRVTYLLGLGVVPMSGVTGLSLLQRVQPNWPVAFVLPSFLLLAAWGTGHLAAAEHRLWLQRWGDPMRWLGGCVGVGLLLAILTATVPLTVPTSDWAGQSWDPTTRLRGFRPLGTSLGSALHQQTVAGTPPLIIATTGRGPVSLLAFYTPEQPRVWRWNPSGIIESQHEIWGRPGDEFRGRNVLIITSVDEPVPADLQEVVESVTYVARWRSPLGNGRVHAVDVWTGTRFRESR
jgi:4-amino-4-deoxy-L-arabinose transferase-like glycosyltransferase